MNNLIARSEKLNTPTPSTIASLDLLPFQVEAFGRAKKRLDTHRAVYLALDPGLGKTIVALRLMKLFGEHRVYIVPAGLKANVQAEIKKWRIRGVTLISDTQLDQFWPPAVIDVLVVDEAQRYSNPKSGRSKLMYLLSRRATKVILLSGTPAPNTRPVELWPVLREFAPSLFGKDFFKYARRYCGAKKGPFGWNFKGFSNQAEFKAKLYRSFMIRMRKDRLDLPEKREGILTVGEGIPPIVSRLEAKLLERFGTKDLLEKAILEEGGVLAMHFSEYLRHLGIFKLKYVFPHIERILQDTEEKLLVFALHKEVIDGLRERLKKYRPIVITGNTPIKNRLPQVDAFQNDPSIRVAILNIQAGGIGWTLTQADRALMVEFSWRDGDNSQASDRANRIGSTKPLLVQYVVLKDSYDAKRLGVVLNKRQHAV